MRPAPPTPTARRFRPRALALGLLVLGGCASVPVPPPDLRADLPAAWPAVAPPITPADPAASAPATAGAPVPDFTAWWRALGDPALDELIQRALAGNLPLAAATERLRAARALRRTADAAFHPNLRAMTTSGPSADSRTSYFQAGFDAQWELGLFGRKEAVNGIAVADTGLAEADVMAARASLVAEVARVYLEWRAAQRREALLGDDTKLRQRRVALVDARVRTRQAAGDELGRAQALVAQADAARIEPLEAANRARQQLRVLLGDRQAALPAAGAAPGPDLGALRIDQAPADLLRARPEIRRAEQQVMRAAGVAWEAQADMKPRIGLGGVLSVAAAVVGVHVDRGLHGTVAFGPTLDMPLFDWGAREATLNARNIELDAALVGYRQSVLEGVAEVEGALVHLALQGDRVAALRRARAAAGGLERGAATRVRLGLADEMEATGVRGEALQAELELSRAKLAQQLGFVALYKALGGAPMPPEALAAPVPTPSPGPAP